MDAKKFAFTTLREWTWLVIGHERRDINKWMHTRELLAFVANSSFGRKKGVTGVELMPLTEKEKVKKEYDEFQAISQIIKQ